MSKKLGKFEIINLALIYFIRISLALVIVLSIIKFDWLNVYLSALTLLFSFLPEIVEKRFKVDLPIEFELLIVIFVYASLFLGELKGYFTKIWWWDILLHALSAFGFGVIGFMILYYMDKSTAIKAKPSFIALFSYFFALGIGALWEIIEFILDNNLGLNMQKTGLTDTMGDLIVDSAAAFIVALFGYFYLKNKEKGLIGIIIKRFLMLNPLRK